jgi:hypothetical protein
MIPKSGHRFSEKIMLINRLKRMTNRSEVVALQVACVRSIGRIGAPPG